MDQIVAAIDIGTTKICTLIAEMAEDEKRLRIIGVGVEPSRGMRKGGVASVSEAAEAIAASVEKAERVSGVPVQAAYVGMGGTHVTSVNSRGVAAISRPDRGVSQEDIDRAMQGAKAIAIPHNQAILYALARDFAIDGSGGIIEPLGMRGYRLEVEAHVITVSESALQNLLQCVEAADVQPLGPVPVPIAAAEAVLRENERESGVVLIDIGGGTTSIAVFIDGHIWHTGALEIGGVNVTNDVSYGLRAPFDTAEEIKTARGSANAERVRADETIDVASFGEDMPQILSRQFLAEIIQARVEEIFTLVLKEIKHSGYDVLLSAGAVLCGGTAQLPGIREIARDVLGMPVRIGKPADIEGLVDTIANPAYAASVGLLRWGLREMSEPPPPAPANWAERVKKWLKALFPG